jgi:hypothetical protein
MKSIKQIALTVLLTIGAFSAITYTACNKDACSGVTCQNGGTCSGGTCTCQTGYTGTNCQTLVRESFVGNYTGTDQCTSGTYSINLSIADAASNNLQVLITNIGGFGTSIIATGTVTSATQVTITSANVGGNSRVLSGIMTFTGTTMQFQYTVNSASGSDNCQGTYSKQ